MLQPVLDDKTNSMKDTTRRDILRSSLCAGAVLFLGGCQGAAHRRRTVISPTTPSSPSASSLPASSESVSTEDWSFHSQKPAWLDHSTAAASTPVSIRGVQSRSLWTNKTPLYREANPMNGVREITIHHDGMNPFTSMSQSASAKRIESIRRVHVNANGWADIGYHFIIDPSGRVWQGRPLTLQGAHVKYNNPHNIGVMMLGNYEQQTPTTASLHTLDNFVAQLMRLYRVPVSKVYTHRELRPTMCPGRNLQRAMDYTRSRGGSLARA